MAQQPPPTTRTPYTTLFRSRSHTQSWAQKPHPNHGVLCLHQGTGLSSVVVAARTRPKQGWDSRSLGTEDWAQKPRVTLGTVATPNPGHRSHAQPWAQ